MCMVEFVKRLYDFMDIYRIFLSQNSYYRYFIDIFSEIPAQTRVLCSRDFTDFSFDRFFLCFFFLVPAENRFFGDISAEKNRFFCP